MTETLDPAAGRLHDLDPQDWIAFRAQCRQALDDMIDFISTVRDRPVWTEPASKARATFRQTMPLSGKPVTELLEIFDRDIKPYATGNLHPAFMGWVHGAGTPVGMLADMLAAGLNMNCGGRNHIGIDVERQIGAWMSGAFDFPATADGLFVTGTSQANFMGVLLARQHALPSVRPDGLLKDRLCGYAAAGAHGCIAQAFEMAGIGSANLRQVPCDHNGAMRIDALERLVARDRQAGRTPFLVVGTAGSVDIGAIDPLADIAALASRERLWFHVDGAFGALGIFSSRIKPLLAGIDQADSIAFDFHKWGHVPYDAGYLLARDRNALLGTFAGPHGYLCRADSGLAAGGIWPCDMGPDLSRGFRALKTWFTLQTFGTAGIADMIDKSCDLAGLLERKIAASANFELAAPVQLNIVCFRPTGVNAGSASRRLVELLHDSGVAAPSVTVLDGEPTIRCAINNHRTQIADIDRFIVHLEAGHRVLIDDPLARRACSA